MKRIRLKISVLTVVIVLLFSGCNTSHLDISDAASQYLNLRDVRQSHIVKIDRKGLIEFSPLDMKNYNSRISQAVFDVIECDFDWENHDFARIQDGDMVSLKLTIVKKGETVYRDDKVWVAVGYGLFDPLIEAELPGKIGGSIIDWEIESSSNIALSQYIGDTMQIEVMSVGRLKEMEDTKEHLSKDGYSNFAEYYRSIYEMKNEELAFEHQASERDRFFRFLIEHCEYDISSEDIVTISLQIVSEYEKQALQFGMSLSEFYREFFGIKEEESFFLQCAEEGEYEIKKILAVGAIAKIYEIEIKNKKESDAENISIISTYEELEQQVLEIFLP